MNIGYKDLEILAKTGTWENIDETKISLDEVNKMLYGVGCMKTNLIGVAAQNGKLDKLPKNFLNYEGLVQGNKTGETPMHFVCSKLNNQLDHIPKNFITITTLLLPNENSTTPLHYLALHGNLQKVGLPLLTPENLRLKNKHGLNSLDFLIYGLKGNSFSIIHGVSPTSLPSSPSYKGEPKEARLRLKFESQIRWVLSQFPESWLKEELPKEKTNKIYEEKTHEIRQELKRRALLKSIKEKQNCLEI
jgi:hypothetical protein